MPGWVNEAYADFARRMPPECRLTLHEISAGKRSKSADITRLQMQEGERMLAAIPKGALVVALDVAGRSYQTQQVAQQLDNWMQQGQDVALLVGGPEGLAVACLERAAQRWSLSTLTFPHPLVRVIVAEQLYRAMSILKNHPYHRG